MAAPTLQNTPETSLTDTLTPQAEARLMEFTKSELFAKTFREGMDMVEETAAYLDGPGRQDAKKLGRDDAMTYASQSMRLTTRLMQIASWLLLQRASVEGEMTQQQVLSEKKNVKLTEVLLSRANAAWDEFPPLFVDLVDRSIALQRRVQRLDEELYGKPVDASVGADDQANPVMSQQRLLQTAFG